MQPKFIIFSILFAIYFASLPAETSAILISGNRARRRRRARAHANYVQRTLQSPIISLFGHEFKNRWRRVNNSEFCNYLQQNWFTNSSMIRRANIASSNISAIADKYMDSIYTPENFPYTWREQNDTSFQLSMNFTENDVKEYYSKNCPYYDDEFNSFLGSLFRTSLFVLIFVYILFLDKFHNMQNYY